MGRQHPVSPLVCFLGPVGRAVVGVLAGLGLIFSIAEEVMSGDLREALKRARDYIQADLDSDLPFSTIKGPEAVEAIDAALSAQPQPEALPAAPDGPGNENNLAFASISITAEGMAKFQKALDSPKPPTQALRDLMRDHRTAAPSRPDAGGDVQEAWQWHGDSLKQNDPDWVAETTEPCAALTLLGVVPYGLKVHTVIGPVNAKAGWWIVRVDGEVHVLTPKMYAALAKPDASNASAEDSVAQRIERSEPDEGRKDAGSTPVAVAAAPNASAEARLREALEGVKAAILEAHIAVIADTLWMPERLYKNGTVVDYIDKALSAGGDDGTKSEGAPLEDNRWITEAKATLERLSAFLQKTGAPHRVDWREWIDSADNHLGLKWPSERPSDPTAAPAAVDVEHGQITDWFGQIADLSTALRRGGPDPMDLQELSDNLERACEIAGEALSLLNAFDAERAR
jgi:hypothetical protein